ncbi:hypothetical protein NLJ89_g6218 [Agrocybe chaxingu]|uniref:JmjC domain-containing protein n=1 Tax=Agrocybe chaxingu TaxID=84603 RepID=A0A9W8MU97_9AGAR|nr:hypothetical protein NLJ89_g6218 [Agrocybe chaxingu]
MSNSTPDDFIWFDSQWAASNVSIANCSTSEDSLTQLTAEPSATSANHHIEVFPSQLASRNIDDDGGMSESHPLPDPESPTMENPAITSHLSQPSEAQNLVIPDGLNVNDAPTSTPSRSRDRSPKKKPTIEPSDRQTRSSTKSLPLPPAGESNYKLIKLPKKSTGKNKATNLPCHRVRGSAPKRPSRDAMTHHVIDLTQDLETEQPPETTNLETHHAEKVTGARTVELHGAEPLELININIGILKQFEKDVERFYRLVDCVESMHLNRQPLFVSSLDDSVIRVLSQEQFDAKNTDEIQAIFRLQNIVVYDKPPMFGGSFDRNALLELVREDQLLSVNDLSIQVRDGDLTSRLRSATLDDILLNVEEDAKALNALDIPMEDSVRPPASLSSDLWAWKHTVGLKLCKKTDRFPSSAMRWALISTCGAYSPWHIDTDGLCTMISVQSGCKCIELFLKDFDVEAINDDRWDMEAILLTPGTKLFMRPNTPHFVFTPSSSICHGAHFYATSTIRETCFGIIHSFVASRYISNTEHERESRELLRRLVTYYQSVYTNTKYPNCMTTHAIDLTTFAGCIDFFALYNVMELANVLYSKTYTGQGISLREHLDFVEARRICHAILAWYDPRFNLQPIQAGASSQATSIQEAHNFFLHGQLQALVRYQTAIEAEEQSAGVYRDAQDFSLDALLRQIAHTFSNSSELLSKLPTPEGFRDAQGHFETHAGWPQTLIFSVRECDPSTVIQTCIAPSDGKTLGDTRFEAALAGSFDTEDEPIQPQAASLQGLSLPHMRDSSRNGRQLVSTINAVKLPKSDRLPFRFPLPGFDDEDDFLQPDIASRLEFLTAEEDILCRNFNEGVHLSSSSPLKATDTLRQDVPGSSTPAIDHDSRPPPNDDPPQNLRQSTRISLQMLLRSVVDIPLSEQGLEILTDLLAICKSHKEIEATLAQQQLKLPLSVIVTRTGEIIGLPSARSNVDKAAGDPSRNIRRSSIDEASKLAPHDKGVRTVALKKMMGSRAPSEALDSKYVAPLDIPPGLQLQGVHRMAGRTASPPADPEVDPLEADTSGDNIDHRRNEGLHGLVEVSNSSHAAPIYLPSAPFGESLEEGPSESTPSSRGTRNVGVINNQSAGVAEGGTWQSSISANTSSAIPPNTRDSEAIGRKHSFEDVNDDSGGVTKPSGPHAQVVESGKFSRGKYKFWWTMSNDGHEIEKPNLLDTVPGHVHLHLDNSRKVMQAFVLDNQDPPQWQDISDSYQHPDHAAAHEGPRTQHPVHKEYLLRPKAKGEPFWVLERTFLKELESRRNPALPATRTQGLATRRTQVI